MQSQERMTQRQKLDFGFHPSKKHRLKAGRMRADKEGGGDQLTQSAHTGRFG
jgi:hypothetical protein